MKDVTFAVNDEITVETVTVSVTPVNGLYNVFAMCLDCEHATGEHYRIEPCVAILLRHIIEDGRIAFTETVFAVRDDDPMMGGLIPAYGDASYCGTITQAELDAGRADELVAHHAEYMASLESDDDGAPT